MEPQPTNVKPLPLAVIGAAAVDTSVEAKIILEGDSVPSLPSPSADIGDEARDVSDVTAGQTNIAEASFADAPTSVVSLEPSPKARSALTEDESEAISDNNTEAPANENSSPGDNVTSSQSTSSPEVESNVSAVKNLQALLTKSFKSIGK